MNNYMPFERDLILRLKEVKKEKGWSLDKIEDITSENGEHVSKTTLSRLFQDGSEDQIFRYETTIRPVVNALLDIETIEDTDSADIKTMKTVMQFKMELIKELEESISKQQEEIEAALNRQKIEDNERFEAERKKYDERIEFLLHQIDLKDKRMDYLLETHNKLLEQILECPARQAVSKMELCETEKK